MTMFYRLANILLLLLLVNIAYTQSLDSLIYAEGKIYNVATKQLISARITYQSLPHGNKVGVINSDSFSFPMFDGEKYAITVEATGFTPAKFMLDPAEANNNKKVIKDIELTVHEIKSKTHEVGQLMRLNNLIFQIGKAKVGPESYEELNIIVNMMRENKSMVIQLEGHTDFQGDAKDNLRLSKERVEAVKDYLISKKIHKARIKTKAFGGSNPLSHDNTPEAHRLNRRVELRIIEN